MREGHNHNNRVSVNHQALLQRQRDGKAVTALLTDGEGQHEENDLT